MKDPQLATQPVMITASLQLRCQLPFFILIFFFSHCKKFVMTEKVEYGPQQAEGVGGARTPPEKCAKLRPLKQRQYFRFPKQIVNCSLEILFFLSKRHKGM